MNPSWANSRWQWMSGRVSCICSRDVQGAKKAATLFTRKSTELASPCRLQRITLRSGRVHHQMGEAMMGDHALSRRWVGRSGRGYLMWQRQVLLRSRSRRGRHGHGNPHLTTTTCVVRLPCTPNHTQRQRPRFAPRVARLCARGGLRTYVRLPMCDACEWSMAFGFRWRRGAVLGMGGPCRRTCMRCSSRKGKTEKWERRIIEVRAHMLCWSLPCVCVCARRPCCYLDVDACIAHAWAHPCSLGSWMDAYMVAKRNQPFRSNSLYSWTKLSMCMLFFPQGLHVYYMLKEI